MGFVPPPQSYKAQLMAQTLRDLGLHEHWVCPQLPASPTEAYDLALGQAQALADRLQQPIEALTIVGSSLGGFYATALAQALHCRAVLLNPAVHAPRDLASQVGTHVEFHSDKPFHFLPAYVDQLQAMACPHITDPKRYLLIAATGDEVLDWREMRDFLLMPTRSLFKAATTVCQISRLTWPPCSHSPVCHNVPSQVEFMFVLYEESGTFKAALIKTETDTSLQIESASGKRSKIKQNNCVFTFTTPEPEILLEQAPQLAKDNRTRVFVGSCASGGI